MNSHSEYSCLPSSKISLTTFQSLYIGQPSGWMTVQVPASIGLQYARATGDYNPHHLYPWSARLLGYSRPMAHGMWTLQRALQCVKGRPTHHGLLGVPVCVRACVHVYLLVCACVHACTCACLCVCACVLM